MDKKVYLFKVSINRFKVHCEMALEGSSSLRTLAKTIVHSFDFQLDHAFGFYNNLKCIYDSTEAYTSFRDDGDPISSHEKSVKNSFIYNVFEPKKKMLFYFDFGDSWEFFVECLGITEADTGTTYPKVTKKKGEAPPQYVLCSDLEDEEEGDYES